MTQVDRLRVQKVPRKMQAIIDYNDPAKRSQSELSKPKKKKQKKGPSFLRVTTSSEGEDASGASRGLKPLPCVMEQGPYESEEQFLRRLSRITSEAKTEANLESKFDIDMCPVIPQMLSTKTGKEVKKKKKKNKNGLTPEQRLEKKRQKRRERDARRKSKQKRGSKSKSVNEFEELQDNISFGEVVLRPPAFSKRKSKI